MVQHITSAALLNVHPISLRFMIVLFILELKETPPPPTQIIYNKDSQRVKLLSYNLMCAYNIWT